MTKKPTHGAHETLADLLEPISRLKPYGKNPRRGDVDAIARSMTANGQYRPIIVNQRTREVLGGNHTLAAAKQLGWTHIAVTWVDVDADAAAAIVLVDNRSNDLAGYDDAELVALLQSLPSLDGTGYDEAALDELLAGLPGGEGGDTDVDDAPPIMPGPVICQAGDVWEMGPHVLAVGDSLDPKVWQDLMGDDQADAVWTDPPYGVAYESAGRRNAGKDTMTIANDKLTGNQLQDFLVAAFTLGLEHCKPGGAWYVASPSGERILDFAASLDRVGLLRHTLVWVKDQLVLARSDYHYRHETIFYSWKPGGPHHKVKDRTQDTIWEIPRPKRSDDHPTMKPVELIARALNNSTRRGHMVVDPFGGSGSTLIAAHTTGRVARLIELDPVYADVICRRWQQHTGQMPVLRRTGEAVDFSTEPTDG